MFAFYLHFSLEKYCQGLKDIDGRWGGILVKS